MKKQGRPQRNSCQHTEKVDFVLFVLCLIVCPLISVKIGFIVKKLYFHSHRKSFSYEIPCDDVSLSVSEDLRLIRDTVNFRTDRYGRSTCVFDNLTDIVENASDRIHRRRKAQGLGYKAYLSCGNRSFAEKQTLHMADFAGIRNIPGEKYNTVLQWNHTENARSFGGSFRFNKGRIRVNTTSFFYIYCSVAIRHGSGNTKKCNRKIAKQIRWSMLNVSIRRRQAAYNNSVSTSLLENRIPISTGTCNDTSTVHMGSHFLLSRDDEVIVQVSDFDRLDLESTGNVFGIYKLE